jgi:hypothetical protein
MRERPAHNGGRYDVDPTEAAHDDATDRVRSAAKRTCPGSTNPTRPWLAIIVF